MIQTATDILIWASAAAGWGFVVRFLLTTWFRTVAGTFVMIFVLSASLIFTLAAANTTFGTDWPGRDVVRFVTYLLTTAMLWWALIVLYLDQRRTNRRERARSSQ